MARKPLNPRQVEVLQWIADGCPDRVWPDFTYKHTAVALQGRRLAKVSKRGGWHAEITDDGRYYLERGIYPGEPAPAAKPMRVQPVPKASPKRPTPEPAPKVEQAPPARLSDDKPPIIVPAQLRHAHPAVAGLSDDKSRLGLTASVRGRALRVLQALATEAESQGWTVRAPSVKRRNEYGYSHFESANHLVVETGEQSVGVRVVQLTDRSPHTPTEEELRRQKSWGSKPPKYDHTPNDYLRIELDGGGWEGKQSNFSEGPRGPIDGKLRRVIEEIAYRSERAKERRLQADAERAERERRWHAARDRAEALLQEHHRAEVLMKQADDWHRAGQLRTYVEAMREKADAITSDDERAAASQWVEWASAFAEWLDPLSRPIAMPEEVEPAAEALRPFMDEWNAFGPREW
jgi:hypothetical protein